MYSTLTINRVTQIDMNRLVDYYIIDGSIEHMELRKVSTIALPRNPEVIRKWTLGRVFYEFKEELFPFYPMADLLREEWV